MPEFEIENKTDIPLVFYKYGNGFPEEKNKLNTEDRTIECDNDHKELILTLEKNSENFHIKVNCGSGRTFNIKLDENIN